MSASNNCAEGLEVDLYWTSNMSGKRSAYYGCRPIAFHGQANFRVWKVANKAQAAALELVLIGGANCNLGCPSLICNVMWWYEVAC